MKVSDCSREGGLGWASAPSRAEPRSGELVYYRAGRGGGGKSNLNHIVSRPPDSWLHYFGRSKAVLRSRGPNPTARPVGPGPRTARPRFHKCISRLASQTDQTNRRRRRWLTWTCVLACACVTPQNDKRECTAAACLATVPLRPTWIPIPRTGVLQRPADGKVANRAKKRGGSAMEARFTPPPPPPRRNALPPIFKVNAIPPPPSPYTANCSSWLPKSR